MYIYRQETTVIDSKWLSWFMSLNYSHQKSGKQMILTMRITFASCSYPPKTIPNIGITFFLYGLCQQMISK